MQTQNQKPKTHGSNHIFDGLRYGSAANWRRGIPLYPFYPPHSVGLYK